MSEGLPRKLALTALVLGTVTVAWCCKAGYIWGYNMSTKPPSLCALKYFVCTWQGRQSTVKANIGVQRIWVAS